MPIELQKAKDCIVLGFRIKFVFRRTIIVSADSKEGHLKQVDYF